MKDFEKTNTTRPSKADVTRRYKNLSRPALPNATRCRLLSSITINCFDPDYRHAYIITMKLALALVMGFFAFAAATPLADGIDTLESELIPPTAFVTGLNPLYESSISLNQMGPPS